MLKFLSIFLLLFVFIGPPCGAITIKTNDVKVIQTVVKQADPETLVIFDVDDVLMHPHDQILKGQNKPYLEEIEKRLEKRLGEDSTQTLYSLIFIQRHNGAVDEKIVGFISNLQTKGVKVLALTNCFTGKFGAIESMEDWRINELLRMGYHFDKFWTDIQSHRFEGLVKQTGHGLSAKNASAPIFKSGVIFTSSVSKGDALKAFLVYAKLLPKKIIFVDDKKKHLESVGTVATSLGIPFVGIEYTAVKDAKVELLNKERADFQFDVLEKEHKWLSDDEAIMRMQSMRKSVPKTGT